MNELKPEDVMKALVYCTMNGLCTDGCPLFEYRKMNLCGLILNKKALALLREKDAEIERLQAYIQRCKSGEEYWVKCLLERPQEARAEAITEFAERLKAEVVEVDVSMGYGNECWQKAVTEWEIDQIAKEMKEGD